MSKLKGFVAACALVLTVSALFAGVCMGIARGGGAGRLVLADAQHGWQTMLEGSHAVIFRTVDGGYSWTRLHTTKAGSAGDGPEPTAGRLAFASRNVGIWFWFCPLNGSADVLRTTNAGRTWKKTGKVDPHPYLLEDVSFATGKVGWAGTMYGSGGEGGSIAKTTNAGLTWHIQKRIGGHAGGFMQVSCPSALRCYVLGPGGVWATSDGGKHWVRRRLPGSHDYWSANIAFPTATTGWAVGYGGKIAKTTNGGRTWHYEASGTAAGLNSVSFCNSHVGYAVGASGTVLRTTNAGATWVTLSDPSDYGVDYSEVQCVDATHAWIYADDGTDTYVYVTSDGGKTWDENYLFLD